MSVAVNQRLGLADISVTALAGQVANCRLLQFVVVAAGKWNAQLRLFVAFDAVKVAIHLLQILGQSLLVRVQALAHADEEILSFGVGAVALICL